MTTSQTHIDTYFNFQPRAFAKFASKRLAAAIPGAAHPGNEPQAQQPHLRPPCLPLTATMAILTMHLHTSGGAEQP